MTTIQRTPRCLRKRLQIVYDLETNTEGHVTLCCWTCIPHKPLFNQASRYRDMWYDSNLTYFVGRLKALLHYSDIVVWAHNGHNFDHLYLLELLQVDTEIIKLYQYHLHGHTLIFADTFLWLGLALKQIGNEINLPKLVRGTVSELEYCYRDVEICLWIVKWATDTYITDLGLPGSAYNYCSGAQASYYAVQNKLPTDCHCFVGAFKETLQQCYYGGRCDSCIYGMQIQADIVCVDARSLYPHALCFNLPCGPMHRYDFEPTCMYIALCSIIIADTSCLTKSCPLIPVHLGRDTIFVSDGHWRGWYTDVDVRNIRACGGTVTVLLAFGWHNTFSLRDFYIGCYEARKQYPKGHPLNYAKKIAMNSSYGKFGQKWASYGQYDVVAWYCLSYSRMLMIQLIHKLDCLIYYGDTDSVFINRNMLSRIPDLMLCDTIDTDCCTVDYERRYDTKRLIVLAKKVYAGDTFVKAKGANTTALSFRHYQRILMGDYVETTREHVGYKCPNEAIKISKFESLTRELRVVVPEYKYKCSNCALYHSAYVDGITQ